MKRSAQRATHRHEFKGLNQLQTTLAFLMCSAVVLVQHSFAEADSREIYSGIHQTMAWLGSGRTQPLGPVARFPIFQYLTGYPLVATIWKTTPDAIFVFWSWCSRLSLAGLVWLVFRVGRQASPGALAWLLAVVLLCGPLTVYGASTFNELPAALLIAGFTAVVTGGGNIVWATALFVLAGLTREVNGPLLLIIWLGSLWGRWNTMSRPDLLKHGIAMAIGFVAVQSTHAAFNLFRYGVVWNVEYFREGMIVHSMLWRVQHAISLWLSPNGGLLVFWPLLGLMFCAAIACASEDRYKTAIVIVALLLALTIGLANWSSPFGWWAWGPRLMLCWTPAAIILMARGYGACMGRLADRLLISRSIFVVSCVLVAAIAIPHVLALEQPEIVFQFFGGDDQRFQVHYPDTPAPYHTMIMYQAWKKFPLIIMALKELQQPVHAALAICFSVGLVLLLREARLGALAAQEQTDG